MESCFVMHYNRSSVPPKQTSARAIVHHASIERQCSAVQCIRCFHVTKEQPISGWRRQRINPIIRYLITIKAFEFPNSNHPAKVRRVQITISLQAQTIGRYQCARLLRGIRKSVRRRPFHQTILAVCHCGPVFELQPFR